MIGRRLFDAPEVRWQEGPVVMLADPSPVHLFDGSELACTAPKDPERSGLEAMPDDQLRRRPAKRFAQISDVAEGLVLPVPGEQVRLVTRRRFSAIELLEVVARRERITDLRMAIYSINLPSAQVVVRLIETGRVERATILMSNAAHREKEVVIKELFRSNPAIDLFFASSHAKLISCKTEAGNHYTIEGSGNHAQNSRVEQYVVDNCAELHAWTVTWMDDVREFLRLRCSPELQQ